MCLQYCRRRHLCLQYCRRRWGSHTAKRPLTCLWASIVGTRIHHTWYTWWGSSYTNSISQVPTSTLPEEANASPHMCLTFYSDINSVMRNNHHHYPHSAWATRLRNIRTLSPSPVKPSPLSIKGDALPPTKEIDFLEVHFFKLRLTRSIAQKPLKHTLEHLAHSGVPVALGPSGRTRPNLSYTPPFSFSFVTPLQTSSTWAQE